MKNKATHIGTCQICGRSQKLPKGVLSKHGYTTEWGFFSGTCYGAEHLPFEESCDLIELMVERCKTQIDDIVEEISAIRNSTEKKAYIRKHYSYGERSYSSTSGNVWEYLDITEIKKIECANNVSYSTFYASRLVAPEKERSESKKLTNYESCKSLSEFIKAKNEIYINSVLQGKIKQLRDYIVWQTKRVASWKPAELTPID